MRPLPLPAFVAIAACSTVVAAQQPRVTTGTVLVANQQAASATIVDVATQTATTLDVGAGPHEAVVSPDGKWGVITIYGVAGAPGNQLAVIDIAAKKVVRTIDLGTYTRPHGASFLSGQANTIVVTSETTQNVVLVDIAQGRVLGAVPTQHPGSHMLGVASDGKRAFTASIQFGGISEIDLETRAFVRDLQVSESTEGVAVAPDGNTVWLGSRTLGTVSVVDTKSWTSVATLTGFGMPYRIGISPDGSLAVVCDAKDNKIHIADVRTRKLIGEVATPGSPRGVKIASDNRTLFVTLGPENSLTAVDLVDRKVLWTAPVGKAPDGVWYGPAIR
jgi:DNA-binding beta-propeller fold protein YncE